MSASTFDPTNRDLTQAAKYINRAMQSMRDNGQNAWAERLSIAIECLASPNFSDPVLPRIAKPVYPKFGRRAGSDRQLD